MNSAVRPCCKLHRLKIREALHAKHQPPYQRRLHGVTASLLGVQLPLG